MRIILSLLLATAIALSGCNDRTPMETRILELEKAGITVDATLKTQEDEDTLRREHLLYWTGLIEEFHEKTGRYPATKLSHGKAANHVKIATADQLQAYKAASPQDTRFHDYSFETFLSELEGGIGRQILPRFDPSIDPTRLPIHYTYFGTADGYLFFVTCASCGVTEISTLLMYEPYLPSLNIASEDMVPQVTKALSRDDLLSSRRWKMWESIGFHSEGSARRTEAERIVEAGYENRLDDDTRLNLLR